MRSFAVGDDLLQSGFPYWTGLILDIKTQTRRSQRNTGENQDCQSVVVISEIGYFEAEQLHYIVHIIIELRLYLPEIFGSFQFLNLFFDFIKHERPIGLGVGNNKILTAERIERFPLILKQVGNHFIGLGCLLIEFRRQLTVFWLYGRIICNMLSERLQGGIKFGAFCFKW